jgi:ATP-binding cassette subfamily B protein
MNEHSLPTADDERYRAFALIRRLLTEQGLVHWRKYAVAFVLMAVAAGCTAFSAYLIGDVINQAYVNRGLRGSSRSASSPSCCSLSRVLLHMATA